MSQYPPSGQDPFAPQKKKGLGTGAIIGIVIGGAFLLLVCGGLCTGIMLPAFGKAREAARGLKATTQVNALVQACQAYASDNKDYLPPAATWDQAISTYVPDVASLTDSPQIEGVGNEMIYIPPPTTDASGLSRISAIQFPANWILIHEDQTRLRPNQMVAVGYANGMVMQLAHDELAAQLARQSGGN